MMRRNSTVVLAVIALAIIAGSALVLGPINRAYAHVFRGSDSSTFLTMIQEVKVETALAGNNTSSSDKQVGSTHIESAAQALSNSTLKEIAERNPRIAKDLPAAIGQLKTSISSGATTDKVKDNVQRVSDLLDEATQVRIEREQLSNTTVQATVVSNLVNKALEHYGKAVAFQGNMTDMSAMASMSGASKSTSSSMSNGGSGSTVQMNMSGGSSMNMAAPTTTTKIVSQADYQSALALAQKAQDMYQQQIKTKALPGKENAVKALDSAFPSFVKAIKDKSSAMDVMMLAHLKVHPNLMEAYDLTVVG